MPPELITAVLSRLPSNEVALSARRTCRAAAQHFAEEHHRTAAIGQPLPPHAVIGPLEQADAAFRGLNFRRKLRSLSVAAASGSFTSLEVVWRLLQPCVFPELLQTDLYLQQLRESDIDDAGTAAVKGGNLWALSWLLERCSGLVDRSRTLEAAAKHCPLPQLQSVWGLLGRADDHSPGLNQLMLDAAAASLTPDAIQEMEWVLQQGGCKLRTATALGAARSGDLARLQWLRERGCPVGGQEVLAAALEFANASVADWLVDEAGCSLPVQQHHGEEAAPHLAAAAAASGSAAKLRWLQAHGIAVVPSFLMEAAARSGDLGAVQLLHRECGGELLNPKVMDAAVASGSVEMAAYLLSAGCSARRCDVHTASCSGSIDMIRWLVENGGQANLGCKLFPMIAAWPEGSAEHGRKLLEAVRLVAQPRLQDCADAEATMRTAAARGDLKVLRCLHEELGWGLGGSVLGGAAEGGCELVLEWLVKCGCGGGKAHELDRCYLEAGAHGDLATLECLRRLGVPWSNWILMEAARWGLPLPVVRWMWGQGARADAWGAVFDTEAGMRAAEDELGDEGIKALRWIRAQ